MIFIKPPHNSWPCCYHLQQQVIFQLLESVRVGRESVRGVRMRRERVRWVTRVSLSHALAKRPCSPRSGRHASVSYSSSVSTFCQNKIKDRNYKSVQQHIFISFSFSGKKGLAPSMLNVIFVGNLPQPPPKL